MGLKIGRCFSDFNGGESIYRRIADFGYEYLEVPLAQIVSFDRGKLGQIKRESEAAGLGIEACNIFFSGSFALIGPRFDERAVLGYVKDAMEKAAFLGIKTAVLGSGDARRRPGNMPAEEANEGLAYIFGKTADIAAENGVLIALEPLNAAECNTVISGDEGIAMVKRVDHRNFKLLLDIYHMAKNNESLKVVQRASPMLRHCHLAAVPDRGFPGPERMDSYGGFLNELRDTGYSGNISVEAGFEGEIDAGGVWHLRRWVEKNML